MVIPVSPVVVKPIRSFYTRHLNQKVDYPETDKIPKKENWHGTEITDDYEWLSGESDAVNLWTAKQNMLSRQFLDKVPNREEIKSKLKKWFELDSKVCPRVIGEKQFQWKKLGFQNHYVLYVKDLKTNKEEVLLDPNTMSKDGTRAVDWTQLSKDGKYLAYGYSDGGTEDSILKVRDVELKMDLVDEIPNTRACSVAWLPKNKGFYYTRYPDPGTVPEGEENYHRSIYFHNLVTNYKDDPLIFKTEEMTDWPSVSVSKDGKWILITVSKGWTRNDVYISKLGDKPTDLNFKPLFVGKDNQLSALVFEDYIYMQTDYEASRGKVMRVSLKENDLSDMSKWETVIPEENGTLESFNIIGGKLILTYQEKAYSRMDIVDLKTLERKKLELPTVGSITNYTGRQDNPEMFYSFESFAYPDEIYQVNVDTLKQKLVDKLNVEEDLSDIETKQVTYNSKDGTPITMFLVHKKGIELSGNNKTLLYGYGGFNSRETPDFRGSIVPWIKQGGIYALANLRGGGEYGEEWHRAGMLDKKQNVFDDFISAAEYLIKNGYTKPEKLAIWGGSNGGLLVGACLVQRPDLFGAVICEVPLLDMIHYERTKIAKLWVDEYGDPNNPEDFKYLYAYSPYHNIKEDTPYPAVFLNTADGDTRVDPMHAKKMTAKLQATTISNKPILLFVDEKAGHGVGKPLSKVLDDITDIYCFLESVLE